MEKNILQKYDMTLKEVYFGSKLPSDRKTEEVLFLLTWLSSVTTIITAVGIILIFIITTLTPSTETAKIKPCNESIVSKIL